jgi:hypothetical protein
MRFVLLSRSLAKIHEPRKEGCLPFANFEGAKLLKVIVDRRKLFYQSCHPVCGALGLPVSKDVLKQSRI